MTIPVIVIVLVCIIIYPPTDGALALKHIQDISNIDNIQIDYIIRDTSTVLGVQSYSDRGTINDIYEQRYIVDVIKSLRIKSNSAWDELDYYAGGGISFEIIVNYPDNSTLLLESNMQASRLTLTTSDGSIFKESCTFDTAKLLSFVLAHDARD